MPSFLGSFVFFLLRFLGSCQPSSESFEASGEPVAIAGAVKEQGAGAEQAAGRDRTSHKSVR